MKLLFLILTIFCFSCDSYQEHNEKQLNTLSLLKSPVVLIGKTLHGDFTVTILVKDSTGKIEQFDNEVARNLQDYNLKDTIK